MLLTLYRMKEILSPKNIFLTLYKIKQIDLFTKKEDEVKNVKQIKSHSVSNFELWSFKFVSYFDLPAIRQAGIRISCFRVGL